jgi:hypothetical protein
MKKIIEVDGKYFALKQPVNFMTKNIHVIKQMGSSVDLQLSISIYNFLENDGNNNYSLLPTGKFNIIQLTKLWKNSL